MDDLMIIGAGPAGITAAVYAARKKIGVTVITKDVGGQAAISGDVENYTGYQFITGPELAAKFEEHLRKFDLRLKEEDVLSLGKEENKVIIKTDKAIYESRSVIVASGKQSRELNVPGEKEFKNHGLSYCATCDGPLFRNKTVAIIGGGNSALDAALQMVKIASKVYIINITGKLTADAIMAETAIFTPKIEIWNNASVKRIYGGNFVQGMEVERDRKFYNLNVEGVFVEIGLIPNSGFADVLKKNSYGEIEINSYNETNVSGIFAAGDVTNISEKQIIVAAGEGAKASLSAFKYLTLY